MPHGLAAAQRYGWHQITSLERYCQSKTIKIAHIALHNEKI
jgi:hypothetical protein